MQGLVGNFTESGLGGVFTEFFSASSIALPSLIDCIRYFSKVSDGAIGLRLCLSEDRLIRFEKSPNVLFESIFAIYDKYSTPIENVK